MLSYTSIESIPNMLVMVMVADEWHNNGPQDLVTVALCIQIAIDEVQLCSLSVAYACPFHNPITTMGHSVHNVDISKPLTHTTSYMLSAICPGQLKLGFIREEYTSPGWQWSSKGSNCPQKSVMTPNCSHVKTLVRMTTTQIIFPETVYHRFFFQKFFGCATPQLSGWLVSDNPTGEEAGYGGPRLVWLDVVWGCEAVLSNSLK